MPKINQEEYEVLKALDDKWKYLARNNMYGAKLEAHTSRPYKMTDSHWSNGDMTLELLGGEHLFQFIQWEDESPYNIQELIEEYLYDNRPKLFIDGQEQSFEFIEESEETEVKDLQWMKDQLEKDYADGKRVQSRIKDGEKIEGIDSKSYWRGSQTANYIARCYLEDLDEPEVLSQEFIDEHLFSLGDKYPWKEAVPVGDLQNLLVPKQERLTIPNYVAKWISEHHEKFDLYPALRRLEEGSTRDYDTYKWYRANTLKFVNVYLTGKYKVEEEQKYEVRCKGELLLTYYTNIGEVVSMNRWHNHLSKKAGRDWKLRHQLTEQEIKDYDERYWAFAEPVEELEE